MNAVARVWSPYQLAIFDFVKSGTGNAIVEAVAGSGKTTTIVEALSRVKGNSIFLAFNKAIQVELSKRGVNARTFHSLGYGVVLRHKGAQNVNGDKLRNIVDAWLPGDQARIYGAFICKLVDLGRQQGIGCLVQDTPEAWAGIVEHHDIEPDHDAADMGRALELASELLRRSNESTEVDFTDLLYIAVKDGLVLPKFDFIFVDEAQDTNAIRRAMLRKIMKPASRLVAVGDAAQAIYGFQGADSESLNMIADEFNAIRLPLTVSYRCPQAVVRHARGFFDQIEHAPGAPEGAVESLGSGWKPTMFTATDLIVCRTTRPLVSLAYQLLKARVPANIMGKEIGKGLATMINKMNARGIEGLITKLNAFADREVEKAIAKKQESKAEAIRDKVDTVLFLIDSLEENDRTVPALLRVIESLFSDARNAVTLATIHKAKGLEARRVFWLNASQCPAKWAKQDWQKQQEMNLCYVATTRAMETLVLIEERAK